MIAGNDFSQEISREWRGRAYVIKENNRRSQHNNEGNNKSQFFVDDDWGNDNVKLVGYGLIKRPTIHKKRKGEGF